MSWLKEALHLYLPAFAELCFPTVSAAIDWSKPIEFLDKEFEKITVDATSGKRFVDYLVRVIRRDGKKTLLLIHIEVQSQYDKNLSKRTYDCNVRISIRYPEPVISLVILADDRPRWKPAFYEHNVLGCKTRFEYPVCKLLDLAKQWSELEKLKSPAATVIMAHVRALQTHGDMLLRLEHKWELLRRLYEQGLKRSEILALYKLLDWLLRLPKPEALIFKERVISYEKERTMEFITDMEQRGLEKGLEQGEHTKSRKILLRLLKLKFGTLPETLAATIEQTPSEKVDVWIERVLSATVLDEVFAGEIIYH